MRRDPLLVAEMIEAAKQAMTLVADRTAEQLQADRVRLEALLWNFTVLGEAAAAVSGETKQRFPDVPWRNPTRLRNRVVHAYWSVDYRILHSTAVDQLAGFVQQLRAVLDTLDTDEPDDRGSTPR